MKKSYLRFGMAVVVGSLAVQFSWAGNQSPKRKISDLALESISPNGEGNAWGTYRHCFVRPDGSFDKAAWFAFKENPANRHLGPSNGFCPGDSTSSNPPPPTY